jgi:hypothetical protein
MLPLCFVLMPFGRKKDGLGREVDFDAVYRDLIAPAVSRAGLEPVRADEEQVGGTIHKPMFERLMLCDYAIADVTGANPNVYYELGIRHALRPHATVLLFAEGTALPFDLALLRCIAYAVDEQGKPRDPEASITVIAQRLSAARSEPTDDSPLFQLIDDMPRHEVDHRKTDIFREHVAHSRSVQDRIATAKASGAASVREIAADIIAKPLHEQPASVLVELYLALRDVRAHAEMVDLYAAMPAELRRNRMVREQRGFALNRLGRAAEAEAELQSVIADFGPSSETYGLLGRVYKDEWNAARLAERKVAASGHLRKAIAAYLAGFEADWRDAFPGVNAVTLMEMQDKTDPRQAELLPLVRYAAGRAAARVGEYWDHATLFELAVLARDAQAAEQHLADALAKLRHGWEAETTLNNLRLIQASRAARGEAADWLSALAEELEAAGQRLG